MRQICKLKPNKHTMVAVIIFVLMLVYFLLSHPVMMDDGYRYEGFAEALAKGELNFQSFYGFHGLSILAVPIFWLTGSHQSIIITSIILFLLSLPLTYLVGKEFFQDHTAGLIFMALILLIPYPYTTMLRGFQESALLFFVLLTIYLGIKQKIWTPLIWAYGGIVKPFALVLFPFWLKNNLSKKGIAWILVGLVMGSIYLGISYSQTGHLVNNAAINSYQGNFNTGHPPPLVESFKPSVKSFGRVAANLFVHYRKIMLSPLVILLGSWTLLTDKTLKLRKEIILAIILNVLLVGSLSFSFSKYLLPMAVLLALCAVPFIQRGSIGLQLLILIDAFFVFRPIYDYFGYNFWNNLELYLLPLYLAAGIFFIIWFWQKKQLS